MTKTYINPLTIEEYQALATGIPTYCPNAVFMANGQTYTAPQAVAFIDSVLNVVTAVKTAKTGLEDARTAEQKIVAQDGAVVRGLRDTVALMFAANATTLAAFKIAPRKPRQPLSTEARAAATAKARATRIARGTESKKKKAAISGNVTGVTITPVTAPANAPSGTSATPATSSTTPAVTPSVGASVIGDPAGTTPTATPPAQPATGTHS